MYLIITAIISLCLI